MSTRTKILLLILFSIAMGIILPYVLPQYFGVEPPVVSVRAEPVFYIDSHAPFIHLGVPHGEGFAYVITNAMLLSVIVTIVLVLFSWLATRNMQLVPSGLQNFAEVAVDGMYNTFGSVDRKYIAHFWPLVGTIFFYVLVSNWIALLPGVLSVGYLIPESELHGLETQVAPDALAHAGTSDQLLPSDTVMAAEEEEHLELVPYLRSPSADLSNTLMLAVVTFFFVEYWGFRTLGAGYLYKFFPYRDGAIMIVVGILELISEFVRIVAFTFRLFGNVFAGEVLLLVMVFLFPFLPLPFLGFELFVGFIQAFIFAVLAMAFSSLATQGHGDHDEHADQTHHAETGGTTRENPAH
jgi:F-type H+-transporting ATPase subunit a